MVKGKFAHPSKSLKILWTSLWVSCLRRSKFLSIPFHSLFKQKTWFLIKNKPLSKITCQYFSLQNLKNQTVLKVLQEISETSFSRTHWKVVWTELYINWKKWKQNKEILFNCFRLQNNDLKDFSLIQENREIRVKVYHDS